MVVELQNSWWKCLKIRMNKFKFESKIYLIIIFIYSFEILWKLIKKPIYKIYGLKWMKFIIIKFWVNLVYKFT